MTDRYIEITKSNFHGTPPVLVHRDDIEGMVGRRSVYEFPRETCEWVMNNWSEKYQCHGSFNGLVAANLPVYSDMLFMDVDDDPESARKYIECLKKWDITHGVWDSGNRSVHIHIQCEPQEDSRVPVSQKRFVEEWGASIGASTDTSFYHAAGLYRLPGTIHEKTGKPKVCVGGHWGSPLSYELVDIQRYPVPDDSEQLLASVWRLLLTPIGAGGRHFHVFKIASNAARLGWPVDKILTHTLAWNSWQDTPFRLTSDEIEAKIYKSL
ncbi:hypothetical protein OAF54_00205 [bacterium]|nr:hypothetical protein [bacterium]